MNKIEWKVTKSRPTTEHIEQTEKEIGIKFPNDFLNNAINHPGGCPFPYAFDDMETPERVLQVVLNFDPNDKNNGLLPIFEDLKDYMPKMVIPFASDPFGSYICFDYRKSCVPSVVFWDRSVTMTLDPNEIEESDLLESVTPICGSFTELINRLYEVKV